MFAGKESSVVEKQVVGIPVSWCIKLLSEPTWSIVKQLNEDANLYQLDISKAFNMIKWRTNLSYEYLAVFTPSGKKHIEISL